MLLLRFELVLLITAYYFRTSSGVCRQSFMTVCDTFDDFKNLTDVENMSELMIGSVDGHGNMTSVDLMHTLKINNYNKLTTIMVLHAVNKLEITSYAYLCFYYDTPLQTVIFYGNDLKSIAAYHFPVFALKKLSLVNNKIETVKGWAFKNHEIESIDLSDNLLEVVESEALPLTSATKIITIKNNSLTHIEPNSFPTSLESLNLDRNKLRYFQDDVIVGLVNLKELTLSHNNFNTLPKIGHLKKLVILDMSFNKIASIQKGIFQDMDDLRFIDFSNNGIKSDLVLQWLNVPGKHPELTISLAMNRLENLNLENVDLQQQTYVLYGNPWDCNTWTNLEDKLSQHESECDIKFLSSGSVPYCINYESSSYPFVNMWDQDIDRFHSIVRESEKKAGCVLAPKKYTWLYPIRSGCVA